MSNTREQDRVLKPFECAHPGLGGNEAGDRWHHPHRRLYF